MGDKEKDEKERREDEVESTNQVLQLDEPEMEVFEIIEIVEILAHKAENHEEPKVRDNHTEDTNSSVGMVQAKEDDQKGEDRVGEIDAIKRPSLSPKAPEGNVTQSKLIESEEQTE